MKFLCLSQHANLLFRGEKSYNMLNDIYWGVCIKDPQLFFYKKGIIINKEEKKKIKESNLYGFFQSLKSRK